MTAAVIGMLTARVAFYLRLARYVSTNVDLEFVQESPLLDSDDENE
jgi:hypothetical protein